MVVPPLILLTFSQFSSQENRYFKVAFFFEAIFYKRRLNYFKLRDKAHLKFEWLKQNKKQQLKQKAELPMHTTVWPQGLNATTASVSSHV